MIDRKLSVRLCASLVFASIYNAAEATDYSWSCLGGNWNDTTCWSPNGLPSMPNADSAAMRIEGAVITVDETSGSPSASHFSVDNSATLRQTGGTLQAFKQVIGNFRAGNYVQSGGSNTANYIVIGNGSGSNGNYSIIGPTAVTNVSGALAVGWWGNGLLNIENGAALTSRTSRIGYGDSTYLTSNVDGFVKVSGSGSRWTNETVLSLGGDAPGALTSRGTLYVDKGGVVSAMDSIVGLGVGGVGIATVTGSGSQWLNGNSLEIGSEGAGTVNIESGGFADNVQGYIGGTSRGNGTANVVGNGSRWNNSGFLIVGNAGTGALNVGSAGLVTSADGYIGKESGGNGTATVSNGGRWENTGSLTVGNLGNGRLNIQSGGLVSNVDGYIGRESNSNNGSARISGAGSHWQNSGNLSVGYFGWGWLNIEDGGKVSSGNARVGEWSGSHGQVVVSGSGALWAVDQDLRVGEVGTGILRIESGGIVDASYGAIGSAGSITVSGSGSQLNDSGALHANGTLNIASGGMVNINGYTFVGTYAGRTGSATIGGAGSQWNNRGNFYVGGGDYGAGGTGEVTVTAGGTVNVARALNVWNTGSVNMRGGTINAYTMTSEGALNFTAGKLNIATDLVLDALGSTPGVALSELGAINVAGTTVLRGAGTLALEGGTLTTGSLVNNGGFIFNKGTLNLTKDNLTVGNGGLLGGMVELKTGQTVNVSNTTRIDSGSVLVLNNGSLNAGTVNNQGRIVMDGYLASLGGGTLSNSGSISGSGQIKASLNNIGGEIRGNVGDTLVFTGSGNVNESRISLLGGSMDFNQGLTNKAGGQITGHGTLATGSTMATGLANQGSLALNGDSEIIGDVNNTGRIVVSAGSTATFHDDVIHNGSEIKVSTGSQAVFFGNVSGAGRYTGAGSIFFEGGFNPGNSPALVSFGGDMSLGEFSHTTLELGGLQRGSEYDAFDVAGDLTLNGALSILAYDLGGGLFSPKLGDTFDLFTAETIAGGFDFITYAALGNGLGWHLDYLTDYVGTTDYVRLSVVSSVPLPAGVWLFGSGLVGLIATRRRALPSEARPL